MCTWIWVVIITTFTNLTVSWIIIAYQQVDLFKHDFYPKLTSIHLLIFNFCSASSNIKRLKSCSYKPQQPFTSFQGNHLQASSNSIINLNSKAKLDDPFNSYNIHHENNENQNDENFLQQSIGAGGEISMEVNKKYFSFSSEQVLCMCEALQQKNDIEKLATFIWSLPRDDQMMTNESIMRARAVVAYHQNSFHELYNILEQNCFSVKHHTDLQGLWFKGHYREAEKIRGRPLGEFKWNSNCVTKLIEKSQELSTSIVWEKNIRCLKPFGMVKRRSTASKRRVVTHWKIATRRIVTRRPTRRKFWQRRLAWR